MMRTVYLLAVTGEPCLWSDDGGWTLRCAGDARVYAVAKAPGGLRDELTTWIEEHGPLAAPRVTEAAQEALGRRRYDALVRAGRIAAPVPLAGAAPVPLAGAAPVPPAGRVRKLLADEPLQAPLFLRSRA